MFIGGKAAGLDFVSREAAYGLLHGKLVQSYAMEAILEAERAKRGRPAPSGRGDIGGEEGPESSNIARTLVPPLDEEDEGPRGKSQRKSKIPPKKRRGDAGKGMASGGEKPTEAGAREFLTKAADCREARYQSVGLGDSLRYEGRGVIGSALALDGAVIHLAFFGTESGEPGMKAEDMAALGACRRYRL